MFNFIGKIIVSTAIIIGGLFGYHQEQPLGTYNPSGGQTYRLQSSIGLTDTSIPLSSFKEPISGIAYTMSYLNSSIEYGTLEPSNTTKKEFVSFTGITQNADGTASLTGVTRGLSFSFPYTASSTLQQTHSGQSIFILSNVPQQYTEYATKQNNEYVNGLWGFGTIPYATSTATSTKQFATREYANSLSIAGAPTSTETIMGISVLSTNVESSAGTASTTDGKPKILSTRLATSTPGIYSAGWIPATGSTGKISSNFIATSSSYTWTASTTFTGSPFSITGATTTSFSATTTFGNSGATIGIGTTSPALGNGLSVASSTYITGGLGIGIATTTNGNIQVSGDIQVSNLSISGACSGCGNKYETTVCTWNGATGADAATKYTSTSNTYTDVIGSYCSYNPANFTAGMSFRFEAAGGTTDGTTGTSIALGTTSTAIIGTELTGYGSGGGTTFSTSGTFTTAVMPVTTQTLTCIIKAASAKTAVITGCRLVGIITK